MSSSFISSLSFAGSQVTIYFGIPVFIAGIIGGLLTILVFLSLKTFQESSCAFYLTVMSFMNIGQLITGLLTRIMINGFNIDWTQTSMFYCKIRAFILDITSLISASCVCLATIDQYFATCTRPHWQQWCNIKLAHRLITICSIIWILLQVPFIVFYNQIILPPTNQTMCTITDTSFAQYNTYFIVPVLWYSLCPLITMFFGILAYRNVQQLAYRTVPLVRRELDKQLTTMVLIQVIFIFPIAMLNLIVYILNNNESFKADIVLKTEISFVYTITLCLFYLYFSCPFYIYISVSERFRRQLIYVIYRKHLNRVQPHLATINQIAPITQ